MAESKFRAPKGTRDVLPPETARWRALLDVFARRCELAGYGQVVSPIFEELGVFLRIGESTDIVTKEMYEFVDKSEKQTRFALRPELTASIVRAYVQHRPVDPWKVWYEGPQFRYERPQAGRYRQFNQVGIEALGTDDPHIDVEVIALGWQFYADLGMTQNRLLINSLGDPTCRPAYMDALSAYLGAAASDLSEQSQHTLQVNPLRVLDSKRPEDQAIIEGAPTMVDFLSADTGEHFAEVRAGLEDLGIPYEISPRLVRGMDYYSRTIFEYASDALQNAQNAVGGGGRYDRLAEDLGGPATPGIGFALGLERILLACDAEGVFGEPESGVGAFVIDVTGGRHGLVLTNELRNAGIGADRSFGGRSMKGQMRAAGKSPARWCLILGDDEVAAGTVTLRDLRSGDEQVQVPRDQIVAEMLSRTKQQIEG